MMRKDPYEKKLSGKQKGEIALFILGVALLVGILVFNQIQWKKNKENGKNSEKVTETAEDMGTELPMSDEDSFNATVENESQTEEENIQEQLVTITNLSDYISPLETDVWQLMEKSLTDFVKQENISADTAVVFHVMIPQSDQESVSYYVSLNSNPETLCLLSYHSREGVVTASAVSYTKEEIQSEVWEDNGPDVRDVSEEADAAFQQETSGADSTTETQGGTQ